MKSERREQSKKPRWLKIMRQPFPRQIEKAYSGKKGKKGYNREKSKEVLIEEIEELNVI